MATNEFLDIGGGHFLNLNNVISVSDISYNQGRPCAYVEIVGRKDAMSLYDNQAKIIFAHMDQFRTQGK